MSKMKNLFGPMRLPFVVLTPACVFLGLGTALWENGNVNYFHFVLALIGAIAAHISVNTFNEYFDFKSGLDAKTEKTPFSGGSGTLPMHPEFELQVLMTSCISLLIIVLVGVFFLFVRGVGVLPLGLAGLLIIIIYSPIVSRNAFVTLVTPGLGFGVFMVMGTHYVLTGAYSLTSFVASLIPFFLVNNLLLLNQFPDVVADKTVGRKNYPIMAGRKKSSMIYAFLIVSTYCTIAVSVYIKVLPRLSLIGLGTIIIAIPVVFGVYRFSEDDIKKLIPFMGMNVVLNLLTPVLVSIGLLLG